MSARSSKPTPAQLYASAKPMELLGLTGDGRLVLWDTGRVLPVTRFQYRRGRGGRRWIDDGHFVINWFGEQVTAHLGNLADGQVSVSLVCNGGRTYTLTRREAATILRYKVIGDPERQAEILAKLEELIRQFTRMEDTPDRQRGEHSRRELVRTDAVAA